MPTDTQPTAKIAARAKVLIGETAYDALYLDPAPTESVDTIEVKSVGASKTIYLPGAIVNTASIEVKILKTDIPPAAVGDTVTLKLTLSESTNGATPVDSAEKSIPCFLQQIAQDRIEGDGATRVEAWVLTLQPTCITPAA